MEPVAWLILRIDTRSGRVVRAGIFSEEHPTVADRDTAWAVLESATGRSYEEGCQALQRRLASGSYAWLRPYFR